MGNIQSDGIAEDMIRAIQQLACSELHAKTIYEKLIAELEEGIIDIEDKAVVAAHLEKMDEVMDDINSLAELRRSAMLHLFDMFPNGDKNFWCTIKHLGAASYTLFEAYQASNDDRTILDLALEANRQFIKALSRFLGVEVTTCASCFSEILRTKGVL